MSISPILNNGISPQIRNATDTLTQEIEKAIQKAKESNIPVGLIVGVLELVKVDTINNI